MTTLTAGPPELGPEDVVPERVSLTGRDGAAFEVVAFRPAVATTGPGVVIGAEGTGVNRFILRVGAALARHGVTALVVDPYRFAGPPDPEAYEDVETLMAFIDALDFVRATQDVLTAVEHLRAQPEIDGDRVGLWGYCTGATLALLAACTDQRLRSAVLFYPSQPTFAELDDRRPVRPIDLLWGLRARTLVLYGDQDVVMPAEGRAELARRLEAWHVDHELAVFAGAGHAFCSEAPTFFHDGAAEEGWGRALAFTLDALG